MLNIISKPSISFCWTLRQLNILHHFEYFWYSFKTSLFIKEQSRSSYAIALFRPYIGAGKKTDNILSLYKMKNFCFVHCLAFVRMSMFKSYIHVVYMAVLQVFVTTTVPELFDCGYPCIRVCTVAGLLLELLLVFLFLKTKTRFYPLRVSLQIIHSYYSGL